jgi:hypothetical protein
MARATRLLVQQLLHNGKFPPLQHRIFFKTDLLSKASHSTIKFDIRRLSSSIATDWNQQDEFFAFTRARFIRDEDWEMAQRRVTFNMNELASLAANAVGSTPCVKVEKYPDGMSSKAFLMTMESGTQVVAKVPNPNAGSAHFTTASEVATMEFVSTTFAICGCILIYSLGS